MATSESNKKKFELLQENLEKENYEISLTICKELLESHPKDKDLIKCKILLYIESSKFKELLSFLESEKLELEYSYEMCYCLFKLFQYEKSLNFFEKNRRIILKSNRIGSFYLEAQINFCLCNYSKSVEIYEELIQKENQKDGETFSNYVASLVLNNQSQKVVNSNLIEKIPENEHLFELLYNFACVYIEIHEINQAVKYLNFAEEECKKSCEGDEKMIRMSLIPVKVQKGYIQQLLGEIEKSIEIYNSVIKDKELVGKNRHLVSLAVAGNNLISIYKGNQSVFEAERRMKFANNDMLQGKLTKWQQRGINLNKILLLIRMKKFEQCRNMFKQLEKQFPETDIPTIIESSLSYKEKKFERAVKILEDFIKSSGEGESVCRCEISLAQLYINRNEIENAIGVLKNCYVRHRPSVVGCLVGLYRRMNKYDECSKIFKESVEYWIGELKKIDKSTTVEVEKEKRKEIEGILIELLKENSEFTISLKKFDEAVKCYEKMLQIDPQNKSYLAGIIIALSKHNMIERANSYLKDLPIEKSLLEYDSKRTAILENIPIHLVKPKRKIKSEVELEDDGQNILLKKKNKKKNKRKNKLPKDYNPSKKPEPDRWMSKKDKMKKSRSHQGAKDNLRKISSKSSKQQEIEKILKKKKKKKKKKKVKKK